MDYEGFGLGWQGWAGVGPGSGGTRNKIDQLIKDASRFVQIFSGYWSSFL